MLYMAILEAKEDASLEDINREREEWIKKGRDKAFAKACRSIERFEVAGMTPLKIFFVIETDKPDALNIITRHFGEFWDATTYPVIKRGISEALEEDRTIVAG